jgi:hypothetical protein
MFKDKAGEWHVLGMDVRVTNARVQLRRRS